MKKLLICFLLTILCALPAFATDLTPSVNTFAFGNMYTTVPTSQVGLPKFAADHYDWILNGVDRHPSYQYSNGWMWTDSVKFYNANVKVGFYTNYNHLSYDPDSTKAWQYHFVKDSCEAHGIDVDSMFVHCSDSTVMNYGGEQRTISTSLIWRKRRFPIQAWYNTSSDTLTYPSGWAWILHLDYPYTYKFVASAVFNALEDSTIIGIHYKSDGVFIDNQTPGCLTQYWQSNVVAGAHWSEYPGTPSERNTSFEPGNISVDSAGYVLLNANGYKQFGNIAGYSISNSGKRIPFFHGFVFENWVTASSPWANQVKFFDWADTLHTLGKMAVWEARGNAWDDHPSLTTERQQIFCLAYYYLLKDENAYFKWGRIDSTYWFGALEYNIGSPLTDTTYVWKDTTDGYGDNVQIRRRNYSNGVVLLRFVYDTYTFPAEKYGDGSAVTFQLGGTYQILQADGTLSSPTSQVSLRNAEATILLPSASVKKKILIRK